MFASSKLSRKSLGNHPITKGTKTPITPTQPKSQRKSLPAQETNDFSIDVGTPSLKSTQTPPRRSSLVFEETPIKVAKLKPQSVKLGTPKANTIDKRKSFNDEFIETPLKNAVEKDADVSWDGQNESILGGFVETPFQQQDAENIGASTKKKSNRKRRLSTAEEGLPATNDATILKVISAKRKSLGMAKSDKLNIQNNDSASSPKIITDVSKKDKNKPKKSVIAGSIKEKPISEQIRKTLSSNQVTDESKVKVEDVGPFNLDRKNIRAAIDAVIKFRKTNPKMQHELFEEDFPLLLQLNIIKMPNTHARIIRLPITTSLLDKQSDICLIVPDVKGIPNKEHDRHYEHYEQLLSRHGIDNIKKVMTFHEFRTDYETFELKSKLVDLYDLFLVDGRIGGKVVNLCGKIFYSKRKVPTSVRLDVPKLKEHLRKAASKTPLYYHAKGDSLTVQFGHGKMDREEMVQNIFDICEGLNKELPGGFDNLRSLNIYTNRAVPVPIYVSLKRPNDVTIEKKKHKKLPAVSGELTTRINTSVTVTASGDVKLRATRKMPKKEKVEGDEDKDNGVKKGFKKGVKNENKNGVKKRFKRDFVKKEFEKGVKKQFKKHGIRFNKNLVKNEKKPRASN